MKLPMQFLIGGLEMLTGLGMAVYWALFFWLGLAPGKPPLCYFSFENSFLIPDLLLACSLLAGGYLLIAGWRTGQMISLAAAGGLIFLGSIDISFNLSNGIYASTVMQAAQNAAINLWCLLFGLIMASWLVVARGA